MRRNPKANQRKLKTRPMVTIVRSLKTPTVMRKTRAQILPIPRMMRATARNLQTAKIPARAFPMPREGLRPGMRVTRLSRLEKSIIR